MSEYQYYEFQAIDRPLTDEEQQAVSQLSSRVNPHPWRAVFIYHWSGFRGDPEKILTRYYDAMLYVANWGSRQLMFRFPTGLVNLQQAELYCQPLFVEDFVSFSRAGAYLLLNIEFHPEGVMGWIDGEDWLPLLIPLRDDILQGDYRLLYLAWLKSLEMEDVLESVTEPPVPVGLKNLSPALRAFARLFEVDVDLIEVAAERSGPLESVSEHDLRQAIARLPPEEREAFLLRLAKGEVHLSAAFRRRLGALMNRPQLDSGKRRTVGELWAAAEALRDRRRREAARLI